MRLRSINTYTLVSLALLTALIVLVVKILGSSGHGRIANLEEEIAQQQIEADTFLQRNQLMAAELHSIKTDPRQIEVLARYHFGMIKPGEVFIQTNR